MAQRPVLDAEFERGGVAFIELALEADPMLTLDGCSLMYGHCTRTGQRDRLRPLEDRMDLLTLSGPHQ